MAQNNPQINEEEEPLFVQHRLQNWYRQGIQKGEDIQKRMEHNRAPYGEEWGLDPELWDETGEWECDERVLLPIQGPVHWSHVWLTGHSAGKEYLIDPYDPFNPLANKALIQTQLDYLATHPSNIEWVSKLGGGSFGVVWEVFINQTVRVSTGPMGQGHWDTQRVRKACKAMRLMYEPLLYIEERVQKMLNDYTVIEGLNHPNVVKYDDYIPIPDSVTHFPFSTVLLIMDLCDDDLKEAIINCPFSDGLEPEACSVFFKQIAPAVQYLHQNRIVHLDIKSDNIFLKFVFDGLSLNDYYYYPLVPNSFLFKLGDFGLSVKYDDNQPMVTTVGGDMYYRAPELFIGHPVQAIPCDIYSLGMTLCETFIAGLVQNARDYINQPRYIDKSPLVVQLIRDMLEDNPNDRPTIEQVLASDWLQI